MLRKSKFTNICPFSNDMLSLTHPSKMTELIQSVKKPPGSNPPPGLPIWKKMELDRKLPVVSAPKGNLIVSQGYLGEKLWKSHPDQKFNLNDPHGFDVSFQYNALHDEHLRRFFRQKATRKRLLQEGLINSDGRALCTMKEYNLYRRFLRRLHIDSIKKEINHRDMLAVERRKLQAAREIAEQHVQNEEKFHHIHEKKRASVLQREIEEDTKRYMWRIRQTQRALRAKGVENRVQRLKLERAEKLRAVFRRVQSRVDENKKSLRDNQILTMRQKKLLEVERLRRLEIKEDQKRKEKEDVMAHKWGSKLLAQHYRLNREKELLRQYKEDNTFNIAGRNKLVEIQRVKLNEWFTKLKMQKKEEEKSLEFMKAIKLALERGVSSERVDDWVLQNSLKATMAGLNNMNLGHDALIVLAGAKNKLEKTKDVPGPVTYATESMLDNIVHEYVRRCLMRIVSRTIRDCVYEAKGKQQQQREKKRTDSRMSILRRRSKSIPSKILSTLSVGKHKIRSGDLESAVSFGQVSTIGEQEYPSTNFYSIKDRPPTPVPSLTNLAEVVFKDEVITFDHDFYECTEAQNMNKLFANIEKKLFKLMESKLTNEYIKKFKRRKSFGPSGAENKIVEKINRLAEVIINTEYHLGTSSDEVNGLLEEISKDIIKFEFFGEFKRSTFSKILE